MGRQDARQKKWGDKMQDKIKMGRQDTRQKQMWRQDARQKENGKTRPV